MQVVPTITLLCPLCSAPLERAQRQWRCSSNHSFDIARQGYVNLLPVQHKKSREPGDSKAMVRARRNFLEQGFYRPIAEKLTALALERTSDKSAASPFAVLDAGCGEGYYLAYLIRALGSLQYPDRAVSAVGLDISKDAIAAAARRCRDIQLVVGTNIHPPLGPGSVDLLLCLFGFPSFRHFRSLLSESGYCILVDPGPDHLIELREAIYPEVRRSPAPSLAGAEEQGLRLQHAETLRYTIRGMEQAQIHNLLSMTPHLYKASAEGKQSAADLARIDLTVDVVFRVVGAKPANEHE